MPISKYNKFYGGNANKALNTMKSRYGSEKGERVFYATVNKKKNYKQEAIKRRIK